MNASLKAYRLSREQLLEQMVIELSGDERFVAAWLTGSHARNEADEVSDLDLTLVIAELYSEILCARPEQVSQRTSEERFAIFIHFGEPALIH